MSSRKIHRSQTRSTAPRPTLESSDEATQICAPTQTTTPAISVHRIEEGGQIGPYQLIKRIGEGGMGLVFLAAQSEPVRRSVALKVVKAGMDTEEVIRRFEQERQALAMMDHPGIAKVIDAGATESGRPFFVMELVEGKPIRQFCDEEGLSTRQRLSLFIDVCHAVQHAHLKGIIHRDLKPSNILVRFHDGRPMPKVIDFGIAKATEQHHGLHTALTGMHGFVGTPAYASPEQIQMGGVEIDTRSDVYSLGVILYELLVGSLPFDPEKAEKKGFDEARRMVLGLDPEKPSTRVSTLRGEDAQDWARMRKALPAEARKQLKGDLDWIVLKALEKDRSRRYETASELAQDIRCHLDDLPVSARAPSTRYLFQKLLRRNRQAFLAAGAAAAALVIGAMGAVWQAARAMQAEKVAVEQRDLAYEAQQEAARQARLARTVSDFLQNDLLLQADSRAQAAGGFAQDPDLTVKAALDRAAASVGNRFDDQPLAEAEILHTIGAAYRGIGHTAGAVATLERSVELAKTHAGAGHPTTLDARTELALAYHESGRAVEAVPILEEVLIIRRKDSKVREEDELAAMGNLAIAYAAAGRAPDAIGLLQETVDRQKASLGGEDLATLASMNTLAAAMRDAGRLDDAIHLHAETLEIQERVLGNEHPDTLTSANNLAVALHSAGRLEEAGDRYHEALEGMKTVLGEDHPLTLNTQVNLSAALRSLGEMDQGINLLAMAATKRALKLGEKHPDTVLTMNALGVAFLAAGQAGEAKPILEATLEQASETFGPDSEAVFQGERNLALAEAASGDTDASVERLGAALERAGASLGNDSPVTLGLAAAVAAQLARNDSVDEAMEFAGSWLKRIESKLGSGHPDALECFSTLEECLSKHERWTEAGAMAAAVVRGRTAVFGPTHPEVARARVRHAQALLVTRDFLSAETEVNDALPALDSDPVHAWDVAVARSLLAAAILGDLELAGALDSGFAATRLREAEAHLQQAREVFEVSVDIGGGELAQPLAETYERLARVCELGGRDGEASEWRAKARPTTPAKVAGVAE